MLNLVQGHEFTCACHTSWRLPRGPRKCSLLAELFVAERPRGLNEQSATGGNGNGNANDKNESDDGH
jgi:hypothetical protein